MKIAAYILFILQALSIFGSISNGTFFDMLFGVFFYGIPGLVQTIGYFLFTIIGCILLRVNHKRELKKLSEELAGDPNVKTWRCQKCGVHNLEKVKICQGCGLTREFVEAQLKKNEAAQPPAVPPVPAAPKVEETPKPPVSEPAFPDPVCQPQQPREPQPKPQEPAASRYPVSYPQKPATPEEGGTLLLSEEPEIFKQKSAQVLLRMTSGPLAGTNFQCEEGTAVVIGRDPARCNLPLAQYNTVSGVHCRAHIGKFYVTVTDLNSSNGTYVNGTRLTPGKSVQATDGSTIVLADSGCTLRVQYQK